MLKRWLITAAVVAVAHAQPPGPRGGGGQPVQPIQPVKPGLYMVAGAGANSEVRVTKEGIILVDGKLPGDQNYNALLEQIKSVSDQPVKFLIVTHHHADHSGNDAKFLEAGAQVIAQENVKKNLLTYAFKPPPAPPSMTYDTDYVVRLGGVEVQLHHYGRSHTNGDTVVYYPDLKVVAVSDLIAPGAPLIDYAGGGSALEWSKVLDSVLKLDFDTCIPGNGNPMTKADVQAYKTKFDMLVTRATELVKKGVPKDQLLAQIKTDDIGFNLRVPDVGALYEELSQAK
jgi:cyclase